MPLYQAEAWQSYTPTVAAVTGAITSFTATGRWIRRGKLIMVTGQISITDNGSGATAINIGIPVTSISASTVVGFNPNGPYPFAGSISASSSAATCYKADGSYPAATGHALRFSAFYEG